MDGVVVALSVGYRPDFLPQPPPYLPTLVTVVSAVPAVTYGTGSGPGPARARDGRGSDRLSTR